MEIYEIYQRHWSPHRLRRAALHLPLRRSERGLLYFHYGLLGSLWKEDPWRIRRREPTIGWRPCTSRVIAWSAPWRSCSETPVAQLSNIREIPRSLLSFFATVKRSASLHRRAATEGTSHRVRRSGLIPTAQAPLGDHHCQTDSMPGQRRIHWRRRAVCCQAGLSRSTRSDWRIRASIRLSSAPATEGSSTRSTSSFSQ